MKIRKVTAADLKLGMLIPWNVYGDTGALLVRKGHMIASATQIAYLIERGSFEDYTDSGPEATGPESVLRKLNGACLQLQGLQQAIAGGAAPPGLRRKLEEIATLVGDAISLNVDIATASILHNQRQAPYPVRHCVDTAIVSQVLARARERAPDDIMAVTLAALTMNLGLLEDQQRWHDGAGAFDAAERARMMAHPELSARLLAEVGITDPAWVDCVLHHHENEDGTGYPFGKAGAQIPPLAKLVILADRYCARVSERGYRPAMSANAALRDILLEARTTLHTNLASLLIRELGVYPIGSYVRLINGEVAVVSRRGLQSTTPHVESVLGPRGAPLDVFLERDTRVPLHAIREVLTNAQVAALNAPPLRMEQVWGRAAAL
ncbi:HD domain-containing protein [Duganella sp. CF517]|uniref:HD-GYP domain-containing protein n=1 Tax=Duganella sp. CF517 TaxID=1881038 RepID=UPI0008D6FB3A|nr:HD domain-containing phosphohydrolase [Duganella sp. CF517]SEO32046.1 HD domain-containing protein [Duganella sp. CF517]